MVWWRGGSWKPYPQRAAKQPEQSARSDLTVPVLLLGALSIPAFQHQPSDTELKDKLQSAAEYLGVRHRREIWRFSLTYLMSVLSPARIQAVIYLWYTARQVQTMLLLPQILYSASRQDRAAIKTNTEDWPLWGFSSVFVYCISYIVTLFFCA